MAGDGRKKGSALKAGYVLVLIEMESRRAETRGWSAEEKVEEDLHVVRDWRWGGA